MADRTPLLSVEGLTTVFAAPSGSVPAVDDVSFEIHSGKLAWSGSPARQIGDGAVDHAPRSRLTHQRVGRFSDATCRLSERDMHGSRRDIGPIPGADDGAEPRVHDGDQIARRCVYAEPRGRTSGPDARAARRRADSRRGVPVRDYPHQLSGGMRQRASIALACLIRRSSQTSRRPPRHDSAEILIRCARRRRRSACRSVDHPRLGVVAGTATASR